jgi:hypothetical protein
MKGGSSSELGLASLIDGFRQDDSYTTLSVGEVTFNQRKGFVEFSLSASKIVDKKAPTRITPTPSVSTNENL